MKESVLQKAIIDYCKAHGIYIVNIYGAGRCAKGVPDLILCVDGVFLAMECKVGKNRLQDDQVVNMRRILNSGGRWCCPRSIDDAVSAIEDVKNGQSIHHT